MGPGKVGRSLAGWAQAAGAELVSVAGRRNGADEPAEGGLRGAAVTRGGGRGEAATRGGGQDETATRGRGRDEAATQGGRRVLFAALSTAGEDLLVIAVPDGAVAEVAAALARRPQARVALHTAGALDASVLAPLRAAGCAVGTLHPLKAFPRALPGIAEAQGIFFALDGDPEAVALGRRLAAAWDGASAEVPAAARPLYHLAASLAAGGAVTLLAVAADLARGLGLPLEAARGYAALARGALEAASRVDDPAAALTGPVARGDVATFVRQADALAALSPEQASLVLRLARETLRQIARLGPLDAGQQALLAAVELRLSGGGSA